MIPHPCESYGRRRQGLTSRMSHPPRVRIKDKRGLGRSLCDRTLSQNEKLLVSMPHTGRKKKKLTTYSNWVGCKKILQFTIEAKIPNV